MLNQFSEELLKTATNNGYFLFSGELHPNFYHSKSTKHQHLIGTNNDSPYNFIPLVKYTQCAEGCWEGIHWTSDKRIPQPVWALKDDKVLPDNVYVCVGDSPTHEVPNILYAVRLDGCNLNQVERMLDSYFRAHVKPYEIRLKVSLSDIAVIFSHVWYQLFTYYGDYYGGGCVQKVGEQLCFNHHPSINYYLSGFDDGGGLPKQLCEELNCIAGVKVWDTSNLSHKNVVTSENFEGVKLPKMPYGYNYEGFDHKSSPVFEFESNCIPFDIDSAHFEGYAEWFKESDAPLTLDDLKDFKYAVEEYETESEHYYNEVEFLTGKYYDEAFFMQGCGQEYTFPFENQHYSYPLKLSTQAQELIDSVTLEDLSEWTGRPKLV